MICDFSLTVHFNKITSDPFRITIHELVFSAYCKQGFDNADLIKLTSRWLVSDEVLTVVGDSRELVLWVSKEDFTEVGCIAFGEYKLSWSCQ